MTIREFIDAWGRITPHGWLTLDEGLLLVAAAGTTRGPMVEVGSHQGRSAMLLAQMHDHRESPSFRQLHCIDPWADGFDSDLSGDEIFQRFQMNVDKLPDGCDVVSHRVRVEDAAPILAEFVYLDGEHTYDGTVAQIEYAWECGALAIAAHDVNDDGGGLGVKNACLKLLGPWRERTGRLAVWDLRR